ncbi:MAG: ABC transporter substrate-binding protein [Burkholderiaceae bacterium]
MRRRIAALLAGLLLAAPSLQARDWPTVRVGIEAAYPPFSAKDAAGQLVGFDVDIANALCAEIHASCVFVVQEWDGMIPALQARKFDAVISSMASTPERERVVAFTGKYYNGPARFVARQGSHWDYSPEGLAGRRIGVPIATIFDRYVTDFYEKRGVQVTRYAKQADVFLDLAAGRIDTTLADVVTAKESFLKTPLGAGFELQGPELYDAQYFGKGAAIATRKTDLDLRDKLDAAIKAIRANGTYDRIRKKYFDYEIWGK